MGQKDSMLKLRQQSFVRLYALSVTLWPLLLLYSGLPMYTAMMSMNEQIEELCFYAFYTSSIFFLGLGTISKPYENVLVKHGWNLVGLISVILLFVIDTRSSLQVFFLGLLLGFAAFLGLPSALSSFLATTKTVNRGKESGAFLLLTYLSLLGLSLLNQFAHSLTLTALCLICVKALTIILARPAYSWTPPLEDVKAITLGKKATTALFTVWLLFSLTDTLNAVIIRGFYGYYVERFFGQLALLVGLPSILVGGMLLDQVGRRPPIVASCLFMGFSYMVLSFFPRALYAFSIVSGISWGFLTVAFLLVVWGDVAPQRLRPLLVSLALSISILSLMLQRLFTPLLLFLNVSQCFGLAGFLLLSAVGLMYFVPETLPLELVEKRRLKRYVKMAKRIKREFEGRG